MKKIVSMASAILLLVQLNGISQDSEKNAGIFYSTLYAKEGVYLRGLGIGDRADHFFLADVNGDEKDDAIAIHLSGPQPGLVEVALSNGITLMDPSKAAIFQAPPHWIPLMGDVNGDQKADLVYVNPAGVNRVWTCLSEGTTFGTPVATKINGQIQSAVNTFLSDMNADGMADLLFGTATEEGELEWFFAPSSGKQFSEPVTMGFTPFSQKLMVGDVTEETMPDLVIYNEAEGEWQLFSSVKAKMKKVKSFATVAIVDAHLHETFLYDVDGDNRDDLVWWEKENRCNWRVSYSTGSEFEPAVRWIGNHLARVTKNNVPPPEVGMVGSMDGKNSMAMVVSRGKWLGIEFTEKGETENPVILDTYEAWGADYIPVEGTYDSGDPDVHDRQIRMIHDAGFTYITLDITNGYNNWVDNRARGLMDRMSIWNENLQPGQHKMFANISLGMTRSIEDLDAFMKKLNLECKRTWEEFYLPYKDLYYLLDNKPMVIHMINTGWNFIHRIESWEGEKTYIGKVTSRWMGGTQPGTLGKPNTYGWIVPGVYGNEVHPEMMPVMPGFWNGLTLHERKNGEQYRTQWLKVLEHDPASVWVNSFNETWEHTSVEPSRLMVDQFSAHPAINQVWQDHYGNRYDHYYWDMTIQYTRLFMDNVLIAGTYVQEKSSPVIYKVTEEGFVKQAAHPVMAPVLLVPEGFTGSFTGKLIKN